MKSLKVHFDHLSLLSSLPKLKTIPTSSILDDWVKQYEHNGYTSVTSFSTDSSTVVLNKAGWRKGDGTAIQRNLWFFKEPMTKSKAHGIARGILSVEAMYIGMHVQYRYDEQKSVVLLTSQFTADQVTTWMRLFSPDPVMRSTAHILSFFRYSLGD